MKKIHFLLSLSLVAVCLGLPGCAAGAAKAEYEGRAVLVYAEDGRKCPATDDAEALGALVQAILPSLVDQGIDFISKMLEEYAKGYEAEYGGSVSDAFFLSCEDGLVSRFKGIRFGYGLISGTASTVDERYSDLGFTAKPNVYFEADFKFHSEGTVRSLRIVPTSFEMNKPVAKRGTVKDVVVAFSISFPNAFNDKKADGTTLNAVWPAFERVSAGSVRNYKEDDDSKRDFVGPMKSTDWITLPALNPKLKLVYKQKYAPVTVKIIIKETDKGKGQAVWMIVSKAVADSKKDLSKVILADNKSSEDDKEGDKKDK